jgi:perosamine synthetase
MIGRMIPLTVPALGAEEIAAVERVLRTGMLVQGQEVLAFEAALAACTERAHAVALCNGTAALELALRALDIGPGDEVLCPALTWPSPAHAVLGVGAELVLVDVDPHEWNGTESTFAAARTERTRAAIVIEQFGNPARHAAIAQALPGVAMIVDAACSLGARVDGAACGSHGVIACTSFHPRKVLTTGEGGACLTNDAALAERLRILRNHGQRAPGDFACASGNYRLTEVAAAIGRVQLEKLAALVAARRERAGRIRHALSGLRFQRAPRGACANEQTLGIVLDPAQRDRVAARLREEGVQTGPLSYALQLLPQFERAAKRAQVEGRSLDNARAIAAGGLTLPMFPSMTEVQVERVIAALGRALAA